MLLYYFILSCETMHNTFYFNGGKNGTVLEELKSAEQNGRNYYKLQDSPPA